MPTLNTPTNFDNSKSSPRDLRRFQILCEARATLWQCGVYGDGDRGLQDAVDGCMRAAVTFALTNKHYDSANIDQLQAIMAGAFAAVRDDSGVKL